MDKTDNMDILVTSDFTGDSGICDDCGESVGNAHFVTCQVYWD